VLEGWLCLSCWINCRGTCFVGRPRCLNRILPLALNMLHDEELTPLETMFVFLTIQHAESLEYAILAENGLKELVKSVSNDNKQKHNFMKLLPSARAHLTMLQQFGRYCHLNNLLGRPSTDQENTFLSTASNNVIQSVDATRPSKAPQPPLSPNKPKPTYDLTRPISPMRVLLLHEFRQNAPTIRDALC
jgi:hypothetical protein